MRALEEYIERNICSDPALDELARISEKAIPGWPGMRISKEEGALLGFLAKAINAKIIVELGTFTGYSSLWLSQSGAEIFTCDTSKTWTDIARDYWKKLGVEDKINLFLGTGLEFVKTLPEKIDLSFIDADKENYLTYYEALLAKTRPGGLIVLDDTLWFGEVVNYNSPFPETEIMRELNRHISLDNRVESVILNLRNGITICRKKES